MAASSTNGINSFERALFTNLVWNPEPLDRQTDGPVLLNMTPAHLARDIELPVPFSSLSQGARARIAESYYNYLAEKWFLTFLYDDTKFAIEPHNIPFQMYATVTLRDVGNRIRIQVSPMALTLDFLRRDEAVVSVTLRSYNVLNELLEVKTYYEFARIISALCVSALYGGICTVYSEFSQTYVNTDMALFLLLVSMGEEKEIMEI